ncbi:ankyrin repeat-containing domain protein [Phaeosphaeriaceae sp. PMI808]|nr:ankyrin repeat-containing domain protein [Phaeosphaeriaceae sp. PMI808]
MPRQLRREDYTVGWVCALSVELAAAKAMLDEEHEDLSHDTSDNDENIYWMGSVAGHNVVIVCLPAGHIGNNPAAAVATQMRAAFKGIRFGLMVGIGGGVPSVDADIRLGDVVVSQPEGSSSGVVQYDLGKATADGFKRTGALNSPPQILLSAVSAIQANGMVSKSTLSNYISILEDIPTFRRRRAGPDLLFKAAYNHERGHTCDQCNVESQQPRPQRERGAELVVHYGTIASGNQVVKNAAERDRVSAELGGVLCFEMEAAGLMNSFPCLVIRGICDYADSHKNCQWQAYAAGTAAAYAKELLSVIPGAEVMKTREVEDAMGGINKRCLQSPSPDRAPHKRKKIEFLSGPESSFAEQRTVTFPMRYQEQIRTQLNNEQTQGLLQSLNFQQINDRQMTIKTAHAKTCRWLLNNSQYLNWLDTSKLGEHHGFLWIKGKAGTGKSTLMKFALGNARKTMKGCTVLSFFFNARGEDIEKSTIGTYRSLLLQLLERLPALLNVFNSLGPSTSNFGADHQWTMGSLKTLLEQAIRDLGNSYVVCFIDALDECEEEQVRDMIQFFEHIGDLAVSNGIRFQVCFSSRHYPHITIRNGLELVLEGQEGHLQDITNYVETELKIGKSKIAQRVRAALQEKASGIFMWVVLVVGILNKESDRGKIHTLQQKLQEIPGDLHELFRDILTRDSHDKNELVLCIQWVLFAKQPLSPEQLYHAIYAGSDPGAVTDWDPEDITNDVIKRFILNSSKGLAEVTVSKDPKAQFIHESVRDFLLKENGLGKIWPEFRSNFQGQSHERLKQCCLNYINVDVAVPLKIPDDLPKAPSQQAASLRKSAAQLFPFLEYAVRNVLYHADTAEGGGISQTDFLRTFPLPRWIKLDNLFERREVRRHTERVSLLYLLAELDMANLIGIIGSVSHCMDVEAERYGCPLFAAAAMSSDKSLRLCMGSIEAQRADNNPAAAVDEYQAEHKSAQRAARRDFVYSKPKDFLLNAAELGHDEVLMVLSRLGRFKIDAKDSRGRTVLWWASRNGCDMSARSLLAADRAMVNSSDRDNKTPLYAAAEQGHRAVVEVLFESSADVNAQGGHYGNALQAALAKGHKEMAVLLLEKGADVNAQGQFYDKYGSKLDGNALQAASANGHKEIAVLLLEKGADVNTQGGHYGNALQAALANGHKEIVVLLLEKGADVNAQGRDYSNALHIALAKGYKEIVVLLLEKGADVNTQGEHYSNALQAALANGHKEIVVLLLEKGADVNAQGQFYDYYGGKLDGNALQAALANGHKEIAVLLLEKGADVNAQGGDYGNALHIASANGYKEIAVLLLEKGADINAQGGHYGNALQAASAKGHKEIAVLLLEKGANVNAQGQFYDKYRSKLDGNALQAASANGHKEIVVLLLEKGANVNAQGQFYDKYRSKLDGNALQAALAKGHKEIAVLLLEKSADINAQGGHYGNALQAASAKGHKEIAVLLLEKGANANAQGGLYSNALQAASAKGHKEIAVLLLEKGANANAQGGLYSNALQAALANGHKEIAVLLLEKGADVNAQGGHYGNALHIASASGYKEIAALLQKHT